MRLEQRLELKPTNPHGPIKNPRITKMAFEGELDEPFSLEETINDRCYTTKIAYSVERELLKRWKYAGGWEKFLDSPLLAHADAAIVLAEDYDAVVGIKEAGLAYADIFRIMGFPVEEIDFSHHKKNMTWPVMSKESIEKLKDKEGVILVDIDVVTGKSVKTVYDFLTSNGIKVKALYLGLSKWSGMKMKTTSACGYSWKEPSLGQKGIGFKGFWKKAEGGLVVMSKREAYQENIIPTGLVVYGSNAKLDAPNHHCKAIDRKAMKSAAKRVAQHLLKLEKK
ncbi:MAG TPA: hypothetical protein VJB94_01715 [Candidatus Nanoarchaeia archaeon]|nr:hypothetical protein [Candidatus Nanoarchaeia archaeon]